jgi:hypothetical protein
MAKAKKAAKGSAVNLVVASKVKDVVRGAGVRAAGDLTDAVSAAVGGMLKKAIDRCKANDAARSPAGPVELRAVWTGALHQGPVSIQRAGAPGPWSFRARFCAR